MPLTEKEFFDLAAKYGVSKHKLKQHNLLTNPMSLGICQALCCAYLAKAARSESSAASWVLGKWANTDPGVAEAMNKVAAIAKSGGGFFKNIGTERVSVNTIQEKFDTASTKGVKKSQLLEDTINAICAGSLKYKAATDCKSGEEIGSRFAKLESRFAYFSNGMHGIAFTKKQVGTKNDYPSYGTDFEEPVFGNYKIYDPNWGLAVFSSESNFQNFCEHYFWDADKNSLSGKFFLHFLN